MAQSHYTFDKNDLVLLNYGRDMGRFPLISVQREKELGKAIHEENYSSQLIITDTCAVAEIYLQEMGIRNKQIAKRVELDLRGSELSLDDRVLHVRNIIDESLLVNHYEALVAAYFVDVVNERLRKEPPNGKAPLLYPEPTCVVAWDKLQRERYSEISRKKNISQARKIKQRNQEPLLALPQAAQAYLKENLEVEKALGNAYKQVIGRQKQAYDELVCANLRLSIKIAKEYLWTDQELSDLIQQGNKGIMRAAKKFDYSRGFKFSTYASYWIRQAIMRYCQLNPIDRLIHVPVYIQEDIKKIRDFGRELEQKKEEELSDELIAEAYAHEFDLNASAVLKVLKYDVLKRTSSLDSLASEDTETLLEELYTPPEDADYNQHAIPLKNREDEELRVAVEELLTNLTPKQEKIVRLRYGIREPTSYSLEDIGSMFYLTKEGIRQVEIDAIERLKLPKYKNRLKGFI